MRVRVLDPERDMAEWLRLRLRQGFFNDSTEAEHRQEMAEILAETSGGVLVAERPFTPHLYQETGLATHFPGNWPGQLHQVWV